MKLYFQQIRYQFRTQPMALVISVVGTALSIALVMLYIQMRQVYITPFAPESNRDRTLHIIELISDGAHAGHVGSLGEVLVHECFYPLQSVEAVTTFTGGQLEKGIAIPGAQPGQVSLPDGKNMRGSRMKGTDAAFWKVFDFTFVHGRPYTGAEVRNTLPVAVIDENMAHALWGVTDVVGKKFELNYFPYQVVGVVRPVSTQAFFAESQVWIPYTTIDRKEWGPLNIHGSLFVSLLAKDKKDFPAIRKECKERMERFNAKKLPPLGAEASLHVNIGEQDVFVKRDQPYDQRDISKRFLTGVTGKTAEISGMIYLLLLLVPALNLSAMLSSSLRKKQIEIGVRRSFGATRLKLLREMCMESFLVTLLGGLLGLLVCFFVLYVASRFFFFVGEGVDLHSLAVIMFNWRIFAYTLLACVVLNLLSSLIPVWKAVHMNIADAWGGGNQ